MKTGSGSCEDAPARLSAWPGRATRHVDEARRGRCAKRSSSTHLHRCCVVLSRAGSRHARVKCWSKGPAQQLCLLCRCPSNSDFQIQGQPTSGTPRSKSARYASKLPRRPLRREAAGQMHKSGQRPRPLTKALPTSLQELLVKPAAPKESRKARSDGRRRAITEKMSVQNFQKIRVGVYGSAGHCCAAGIDELSCHGCASNKSNRKFLSFF